MKLFSFLAISLCVVSLVCVSINASADVPHYGITGLGVRIPAGCVGAAAINDQGQVIGWGHSPTDNGVNGPSQIVGDGQPNLAGFNRDYSTGKLCKQYANGHTYLWQNGRRQNLGVFSGCGMNARGQIIGQPFDSSGGGQPFVWEHGVVRHLPNLPGGCGEDVEGINDSGQVVGLERGGGPGTLHAFLWQSGRMTDLGDFAGKDSTLTGICINNRGQVAVSAFTYSFDAERHPTGGGTRRFFLWQNGQTQEISAFVGPDADVLKINDKAEMIGSLQTKAHLQHAAFWSQGKRRDLGTLGGQWSQAFALNNAGQVVGAAALRDGKIHAFLSDKGKLFDLNKFLPAHSYWVLQRATGINNQGLIVGDGLYRGHNCSFLLTPQGARVLSRRKLSAGQKELLG